jgi:predicted transcriptional regulator
MPNQVFQLLDSLRCGEAIRSQTPLILESTMEVADASQLLAVHKISSAPVFDPQLKAFVGVLSYRDIVDKVKA